MDFFWEIFFFHRYDIQFNASFMREIFKGIFSERIIISRWNLFSQEWDFIKWEIVASLIALSTILVGFSTWISSCSSYSEVLSIKSLQFFKLLLLNIFYNWKFIVRNEMNSSQLIILSKILLTIDWFNFRINIYLTVMRINTFSNQFTLIKILIYC